MVVEDLSPQAFPKFYRLFSDLMYEGYADFPRRLQSHFLHFDYSEKAMSKWLQLGIRKFLVAKEADDIVGFLVGDNSYGGVSFISWLGVAAAYRGKGIGSELLTNYEEYARTKKAHIIELFTFESVQDFYAERGYEVIGRRDEGYYGRENIIMNKKIGSWNLENLPDLV